MACLACLPLTPLLLLREQGWVRTVSWRAIGGPLVRVSDDNGVRLGNRRFTPLVFESLQLCCLWAFGELTSSTERPTWHGLHDNADSSLVMVLCLTFEHLHCTNLGRATWIGYAQKFSSTSMRRESRGRASCVVISGKKSSRLGPGYHISTFRSFSVAFI